MIQEYNKCLRCGRRLKTQENRERGYGDICWKKMLVMQKGRLFEIAKSKT